MAKRLSPWKASVATWSNEGCGTNFWLVPVTILCTSSRSERLLIGGGGMVTFSVVPIVSLLGGETGLLSSIRLEYDMVEILELSSSNTGASSMVWLEGLALWDWPRVDTDNSSNGISWCGLGI